MAKTTNGKLIYDTIEGYTYEKDGRKYSLLEGITLHGNSTSDVCFVMEIDPEGGYKDITTWFCLGANTQAEILSICDEYITGEPTAEEKLVEMKEKVSAMEKELAELRKALLTVTRESHHNDEVLLTRKAFHNLYKNALMDDEFMEEDIYGHDVHVSWHGVSCNCGDGVAACNNIIDGVKGCIDEDDDEDY